MKTIPITVNFNNEQVIGTATIDLGKLPAAPNYVFSIGYFDDGNGGHELLEISLVLDTQYINERDRKISFSH